MLPSLTFLYKRKFMKHLSIVLMGLFIISCGKNSSGGSDSPQGYRNPVVSEDGAKVELYNMIN